MTLKGIINLGLPPELLSRALFWIYSAAPEGIGKTAFANHLETESGALIIKPGAKNESLALIQKRLQTNEKFQTKPIVCIDFERATDVSSPILYQTIEAIQGGGSGEQRVTWPADTRPLVIVFANDPPSVEKLTADRLKGRVFYIPGDSYKLERARHIDAQLEEAAEKQRKKDELHTCAARTGVPPPGYTATVRRGSGSGDSDAHHVRSRCD
jgi:hypothetical protein